MHLAVSWALARFWTNAKKFTELRLAGGEPSDDALKAFAKWFADNGGQLNSCHVARTAEGCGIVADAAIEQGKTSVAAVRSLLA